jgi:asparagine synthase (glutamine-hydrolysing)
MCGICGAADLNVTEARLRHATDLMRHRGPDDAGYFRTNRVALGMRRLSVIDLAGGSQPKTNESGTVQVVFNGEIYNFRELRRQLTDRGHVFESHSDTEVIVHGYEEWGTECFRRLNGIFTIAVWDAPNERLVLARDHLGIKPLFYCPDNGQLVFGSELKPVLALLASIPEIDPYSFAMYLRYQYVPTPRSILMGVCKLPPAHFLAYDLSSHALRVERYWDPMEFAENKRQVKGVAEAEALVEDAMRSAVKRQLISDVPLGAFLSGGIDSSTVVALMGEISTGTTKTFSIGFREKSVDESPYAREVAQHLGTEHHERIVTAEEALEILPRLHHFFDEPFSDSSAIPTYLVSQLARQHVTVSLSGDGGDELFGGYDRYMWFLRLRHLWRIPAVMRGGLALLGQHSPGYPGRRARAAVSVLRAPTAADAYRNLVAPVGDTILHAVTFLGADSYRTNQEWPSQNFSRWPLLEAMMLTDLTTYLPDDILTKVDRASMACSLEARVPFLDRELVEIVLSLPVELRSYGEPKGLLKRILRRHIPSRLVDRPKMGFGIPIHEWLRNQLYQSLREHTSADRLARHGLLRPDSVALLVDDHASGRLNRGYTLWAIYMFQMWYENFYERASELRSVA